MYLSYAYTFGPIFVLVEKWGYVQEGSICELEKEIMHGEIWYMIRYFVLFSITEAKSLSRYMKKVYI